LKLAIIKLWKLIVDLLKSGEYFKHKKLSGFFSMNGILQLYFDIVK